MKKVRLLLTVTMLAVLLLSVVPANAEAPSMSVSCPRTVTLSMGEFKEALETKINHTCTGFVTFVLYDGVTNCPVYSWSKHVSEGSTVTWAVPYYRIGMSKAKPIRRMNAVFYMDGKSFSKTLCYKFNASDRTVTVEAETWYPNNTACSFGLAFRDIKPALTSKWYNFTPVDLSIQGHQEFDYIASNLYIIGKVNVDVHGDSVVVTYSNFYEAMGGNIKTKSEFLTFFPDLDSVKQVEPEEMQTPGYRFGQVISIENDLGGDTHVLLFIRNRVDYCNYPTDKAGFTRFWPNLKENIAYRDQLLWKMNSWKEADAAAAAK